GYPIEQARLADVGCTENRDGNTGPQPLTTSVIREMMPHLAGQLRCLLPHPVLEIGRQFILWKIERGLDAGQDLHQSITPALDHSPERALHLAQRLPALRLALRGDEIGEPLDLAQIEPTLIEGAPRKLSWLGKPQAR